MIMVYRLTILD